MYACSDFSIAKMRMIIFLGDMRQSYVAMLSFGTLFLKFMIQKIYPSDRNIL